MLSAAQTVAWAVVIVFATTPPLWLTIHPFTRFWQRRRKPLLLIGIIWATLWTVAGLVTAGWRHERLLQHPALEVGGVILAAAAVYVYYRTRHSLSLSQIVGRSETQPHKHPQRLVTTGIRARVRHPLYLGNLLMLLALTLFFSTAALYALAVFAVVTGAVMIRFEERELEARFGAAYRDYKRRVPAIIPRMR